jgi:DNA-directed RNA polymerase subunit RPC12/RpoP
MIMDEQEVKRKTASHQCPNCGGSMKFDPATQTLKCERCGSSVETDNDDEFSVIEEHDFNEDEHRSFEGWTDTNRVYRCDYCGAQTTLDIHETAGSCPFCGSPQIVRSEDTPGIKPESIVPFAVSERDAEEKFRAWIKGKFFAVKGAKTKSELEQFKGVYLPFWTFDADTFSSYVVNVGNDYTDDDGNTHTVWHKESGTHSKIFDDVLIPASSSLDENEVRDIYPFNTTGKGDLKPYKTEYLSGFSAERYSVGLKEGHEKALADMNDTIRSEIVSSVSGDHVNIVSLHTDISDETYKHILAPIWISSFLYNGKSYRFLVNGQTGKVSGKYPISKIKVALVVLLILIILGIIIYYIMQ